MVDELGDRGREARLDPIAVRLNEGGDLALHCLLAIGCGVLGLAIPLVGAAACLAVARTCATVAAVIVRWPILRPRLARSLPYRCRCAPGKASTADQSGVCGASPPGCPGASNHRSPSRFSITAGLCWRGGDKGRPASVRTCRSNCDSSQASSV